MNHTLDCSEDTGHLTLSEALTIEDSTRLKEVFSEALGTSATHLNIDLSDVPSIDLCCLQVLCSAHRTAVRGGKTLALLHPGDGFLEAVRKTGYLRHLGCMKAGAHDCLWMTTTEEKAETGI